MPIIELPREVVDKIAAGEVVERPASVVKELVENSLDAGAGLVEVEVRGGGLELIRVSDDGSGMSREDLALSVRPHATSKIGRYEDILEAVSYGFRGEALPSIAAVSRLEITTRQAGESRSWTLSVGQGGECRLAEAAAAPGTTVEVSSLFGNLPARRKFLRSPQAEARKCSEEVILQALARPEVGFRILVDGRLSLDLVPSEPGERWRQALGDELYHAMLPVEDRSGDLSLTGVFSKPDRLWPRRREQHIYVNGRKVGHRLVQSAVYKAYGPALEGRHPAFLLFLTMPPRSVDVNVHPAKREVRFRDDDLVFRFVRNSLEKSLFGRGQAPMATGFGYPERPGGADGDNLRWGALTASDRQGVFDLAVPPEGGAGPREDAQKVPMIQYWQLHDRYILAPIKNGLILVDQHAAHERILFEELLARSSRVRSQQLMFPATIELTSLEHGVFKEYQAVFSDLGFDLKEFGGRAIVVEGLPAPTAEADAEKMIRGILEELASDSMTGIDPAERVARSFACHAAVKAGQPLSQEEMNRLIDRLFATSSPYLDPHGRPAVIKLTLEELERRFGRV